MSKKRLIFTLIYSDGCFNLSRNFKLQNVGDLSWLKNHYDFSKISFSIDELLILDASREKKKTSNFFLNLNSLSSECFIPVGAGGGIENLEDAKLFFENGADKVILNSVIFKNPEILNKLSKKYGHQSICVSIDFKMIDGNYFVVINNGQELIDIRLDKYLNKIMNYPIGEIYLNSVDRDGTGQGMDKNVLNFLPKKFKFPIILGGGAGKSSHLIDGLKDSRISAVSTANLFNFIGDGLKVAREEIILTKIDVPIWEYSIAKKFKNIFS